MKSLLWDMLTNIQNGQLVKKSFIIQKKKKICEAILNILWNEGYISGYKQDNLNSKKLKIFLKYTKNKPTIQTIKKISKPGLRNYYSVKQLWKIDSSKTFLIVSTSMGVKTLIDCKKLKIGGEPLFIIN